MHWFAVVTSLPPCCIEPELSITSFIEFSLLFHCHSCLVTFPLVKLDPDLPPRSTESALGIARSNVATNSDRDSGLCPHWAAGTKHVACACGAPGTGVRGTSPESYTRFRQRSALEWLRYESIPKT